MAAEVDGYVRLPSQGMLVPQTFSPGLSIGAAGPGLAWSAFFPSSYGGTQAVAWGIPSAGVAQGGAFTVQVIPGRQYTASIYVFQLTAGNSQEITIDGTTVGTSVAIPLAWTRLLVTFTASQPFQNITVQTPGAAVPGGVYVDNIMLQDGSSASAFTNTGPAIYGIFRGYVERWPSAWLAGTAGFRGEAPITCVDAFGPLNLTPLGTEIRNCVSAKNPTYYWPLGEPQGAGTFAEVTGNGPPMQSIASPSGAGAGIQAGQQSNLAGDAGGVAVEFTRDSGGGFHQQATIIGVGTTAVFGSTPITAPTTIGTSWQASLACWVKVTDTSLPLASIMTVVHLVTYNDGFSIPIDISIETDGTVLTNITNQPAGGVSYSSDLVSSANVVDGAWHLIVAMVSQDSTNTVQTLYVDAHVVTKTTATSTLGGLLSKPADSIEVGGNFVPGLWQTTVLDGLVTHVASWDRVLSVAEVADLVAATGGYVGETSGARVARYLGYGWNGLSYIQTGESIMGVSNLASGTALLAACQDVTTSENGNFWSAGSGYLTFAARTARYLNTTSMYTFGENTAGGEYPYQDGILYDFDPTYVYNNVTVTQSGGIIANASDAASQQAYFSRAYTREINVLSANETIDAANYLLNQYKDPRQRVASIVLDPASHPQLWPVVLGIEVGTRVTVKRRASGGGLVMSGDFFVEQISHGGINMETGAWQTTLLLSPVDLYQVGILDDPVYGLLDSSMILAY